MAKVASSVRNPLVLLTDLSRFDDAQNAGVPPSRVIKYTTISSRGFGSRYYFQPSRR